MDVIRVTGTAPRSLEELFRPRRRFANVWECPRAAAAELPPAPSYRDRPKRAEADHVGSKGSIWWNDPSHAGSSGHTRNREGAGGISGSDSALSAEQALLELEETPVNAAEDLAAKIEATHGAPVETVAAL